MNRTPTVLLVAGALLAVAGCEAGVHLGSSQDKTTTQPSANPSGDPTGTSENDGSNTTDAGLEDDAGILTPTSDAGTDTEDAGTEEADAGTPGESDAGTIVLDGGVVDANVYLTSTTALYRYDPAANSASKVGDYNCISNITSNDGTIHVSHIMRDVALDSKGNLYGVTYNSSAINNYPGTGAFVKVSTSDASCTRVYFDPNGTNAHYPGGVEFFPVGMVDPAAEALLGFGNGDLYRTDPSTGKYTYLGMFGSSRGIPEAGLFAFNGKAYTRFSELSYVNVAVFHPTTGRKVSEMYFSGFPRRAYAMARVGTQVYAFGTKDTNQPYQVFVIDLIAETVTASPWPVGLPNGILGATSAPSRP